MNKIRFYRRQKNITQDELAKSIGVKRTTISMIENDINKPSLTNAMKLANFFGVSVEELFPQFKDSTKRETPSGV